MSAFADWYLPRKRVLGWIAAGYATFFVVGGACEQSNGVDLCPPNLTGHPTGVTGRLDEDAFGARIREGRATTESIIPWENFGQVEESDLRSVYRYLRTLPPVDDARVGIRQVGG